MSNVMTAQEVNIYLAEQKTCRLATVDPQGRPHVAPVWHVILDGEIYIETGGFTKKVRNLKANPQLCLAFDSGDNIHNFKGVVIQGQVEFVRDKALIARFREAFAQRYFGSTNHPDFLFLMGLPELTLMRVKKERVASWDYTKSEG